MRKSGTVSALASLLLVAACSGPGGTPVATATPTPTPAATVAPDGSSPTPGALSPTPTPTPTTVGSPAAMLEPVAGGFDSPLLVVAVLDGSGRLLVVEQGGLVKTLRDGLVARTPFLDVRALTDAGGERGLLGLAFHPDFPRDPRIFVDYTDRAGDTVVASYRVGEAGRGATADPASGTILLRVDQPYANHNGGHLAFGPDGFLYIGMGDGGSGGDPEGNGQRRTTLLGKILRIDVDRAAGGRPYAIPADNPFARGGGAPEIWALGVRNPWRFSFDPGTGDLWVGDVGQNAIEEVDVIRAGTPGGVNLGWKVTEGDRCFEPSEGCDASGFLAPVAVYRHDAGCSVTGGVVARGAATGSLAGHYLFADYCGGWIRALDAAGAAPGPDGPRAVTVAETGRSIVSFGLDADGSVLVVDIAGGELLRLRG